MSFINALLRPLFDTLLYPFRDLPPIVGITVVSLVTAIGLLIVFKHTSNQKALEDVKRHIHAGLFEIRLFNDDFRAIMRAQGDILRHNLRYMRYSMVPMVWTLPPLVLIIAQLQFHYGYEGPSSMASWLKKPRWPMDISCVSAPRNFPSIRANKLPRPRSRLKQE